MLKSDRNAQYICLVGVFHVVVARVTRSKVWNVQIVRGVQYAVVLSLCK